MDAWKNFSDGTVNFPRPPWAQGGARRQFGKTKSAELKIFRAAPQGAGRKVDAPDENDLGYLAHAGGEAGRGGRAGVREGTWHCTWLGTGQAG